MNTLYWQDKRFLDWAPLYPGTPNFVGTTTWVEDNIQYVQADYSAIVSECPQKVDYTFNSGIWTQITANLGTRKPYTPIKKGIYPLPKLQNWQISHFLR